MQEFLVLHSSNTSTENDSASYTYFHLQLEWRWIYLTILLKIDMKENPVWENVNEKLFFFYSKKNLFNFFFFCF